MESEYLLEPVYIINDFDPNCQVDITQNPLSESQGLITFNQKIPANTSADTPTTNFFSDISSPSLITPCSPPTVLINQHFQQFNNNNNNNNNNGNQFSSNNSTPMVSNSNTTTTTPVLSFSSTTPSFLPIKSQLNSATSTNTPNSNITSPIMTSNSTMIPFSTSTSSSTTTTTTTTGGMLSTNPITQSYQTGYHHPEMSPQTHEHFLRLLTQIQQHQQQSITFQQQNHEYINSKNNNSIQPLPEVKKDSSNLTVDDTNSTLPTIVLNNNNNNILSPTISTSPSPSPTPFSNENQQQSTITTTSTTTTTSTPANNNSNNNNNNNTVEAIVTLSIPNKKNSRVIASPPNSPRKPTNNRNNNSKIKNKTQQVQMNIQQQQQLQLQQQQQQQQQAQAQQQLQTQQSITSPLLSSSSNSTPNLSPTINSTNTFSNFSLTNSSPPTINSTPPQSPPLPPPPPTATSTSTTTATMSPTKMGPTVSSIVKQLSTSKKSSSSSSLNNSSTNIVNITNCTENLLTTSTSSTTNNEDKKTICLNFLNFFFNVNPSLTTQSTRRPQILALYVNKIQQELRYRRPNDMANLCVVLYGHLFSSLDEQTIKDFIAAHSLNSSRSKKEERRKKRKRDLKQEQLQQQQQQQQHHLQFQQEDQVAKVANINNALSPRGQILSNEHQSSVVPSLVIDNENHLQHTLNHATEVEMSATEEEEEPPISLHDAFINCLKACTLLPFIELKPISQLPATYDALPGVDPIYTMDDLNKWESQLKDLKSSAKNNPIISIPSSNTISNSPSLLTSTSTSNPQSPSINNNNTLVFSTFSEFESAIKNSGSNNNNDISSNIGINDNNTEDESNDIKSLIFNNNKNLSSIITKSPLLNTNPINNNNTNNNSNNSNNISNTAFINNSNSNNNNSINTSNSNNLSSNNINDANSGVLVNVYDNPDDFTIYVAIPHSQDNSLKVTVNQNEVIVEGIISIPDTIYLPNGNEMIIPVGFPIPSLQRQEFFEGAFEKRIPLASPVSSYVVGKKEGIIVIIARKDITSTLSNILLITQQQQQLQQQKQQLQQQLQLKA